MLTKLKDTISLVRKMGIYALSPAVRSAWIEQERLNAEVRDLEAQRDRAEKKLRMSNATYRQEVRKTFLA